MNECVRLELVGLSHSLEPMEELKQTMRDVGRHMLNDPLLCLRGQSGKVLTCGDLMYTHVEELYIYIYIMCLLVYLW